MLSCVVTVLVHVFTLFTVIFCLSVLTTAAVKSARSVHALPFCSYLFSHFDFYLEPTCRILAK